MVCIFVKDVISWEILISVNYESSMCLMKSGLLTRMTDLNSVKHCCNHLGCLSSYVRARRKELDMEGALR